MGHVSAAADGIPGAITFLSAALVSYGHLGGEVSAATDPVARVVSFLSATLVDRSESVRPTVVAAELTLWVIGHCAAAFLTCRARV